ncbi:MAG: hypothetical protein M3P45_00630, partial [Acidobacteriota bacterium]|nr:hypothetical protein [Acidobacteriota bacterium]
MEFAKTRRRKTLSRRPVLPHLRGPAHHSPLRCRGNDINLLADHFLEKFSREFAKPGLELSAEARERLLR